MRKHDSPDRMIQAIARELKRPVSLDPTLSDRVLRELNQEKPSKASRRLIWLGLALAAGISAVALFTGRSAVGPSSHQQGISFTLDEPMAQQVSLVGDFNNWDPMATPLARATSGQWSTVIPLTPGRYQFTFVVDGNRWVADPRFPKAVGDDYGQPTSVITIVNHTRS